jgi:hypothetical protein
MRLECTTVKSGTLLINSDKHSVESLNRVAAASLYPLQHSLDWLRSFLVSSMTFGDSGDVSGSSWRNLGGGDGLRGHNQFVVPGMGNRTRRHVAVSIRPVRQ